MLVRASPHRRYNESSAAIPNEDICKNSFPAFSFLPAALPCLLTITPLPGCISGQMGPDDQHYHNLAHPKHTPILTIKWANGNLAGH